MLMERSIAKAQALWPEITAVRLHVMANNAAVRFDELQAAGTEVAKGSPARRLVHHAARAAVLLPYPSTLPAFD